MAGRNPDAVQASPNQLLIQSYLPWISGAVLAGGAVFSYPGRDYVLVGLMLFLPLLDRKWKLPDIPRDKQQWGVSAGLILFGAALLVWKPEYLSFGLATLFLAALPEEWFFRAYFMTRLGQGWRANLLASLLFSLLHGLTQGWPAAMRVFLPSLFFGWLYQRTRNLILLVLIHMLSNLLFVMFFSGYLEAIYGKFL